MSRRVQAILLCEDLQQQVFFRRMLSRLGYGSRGVRVRPLPGGGSAEQYVREQYAEEVRTHRRAHHAQCLVVATDADKFTVERRYSQLGEALQSAGEAARSADEPVAILVPKWHIETWIRHLLTGGAVSEDEPCPKLTGHESDCHPAAEKLATLAVRSEVPVNCPLSLERAIQQELPRLPKASP